ncbi:glycoside hydrolase family 5 protein [Ruminococcus sp.]|uniref:glycoside hydrolase family 5 protein n=1 Tax=Ruminococcus sp. TaxID=41978 RepID=UPI0025E5A620|nr:glycoside hydrolase family 5 protein [Ruminococcus sp.]
MRKIRKINLNKTFAAAMAAVLSAVVFTACGNSDNSSSSKSDGSSSHVTEKAEMRDITSMDLVKEMKLGWNLGNSLDVCNADRDGDGQVDENSAEVDETLWGNVKTTPEMFDQLKKDGFNAVRIPVTWRDHLSDDYTIDEDWLNRVEEVVDYAYDRDFYVIINVHHDGGGDPDFGAWIRTEAVEDYDKFIEKYNKIWTQIAKRFENYSDKLIFESMNEVGFDDLGTNQAYELLNKINQDFVDLIRKQGGNNPERHLLIAGYWTDIDKTCSKLFKMPDDPENRCIVSVHYYTPWEFCVCTNQHNWGSDDEVKTMENNVNKLKTNFIDNNIPVIVGEYGNCKGNDETDRVRFDELFTKLTYEIGVAAFLWDDGGVFDRTNLTWQSEGLVEALNGAIGK